MGSGGGWVKPIIHSGRLHSSPRTKPAQNNSNAQIILIFRFFNKKSGYSTKSKCSFCKNDSPPSFLDSLWFSPHPTRCRSAKCWATFSDTPTPDYTFGQVAQNSIAARGSASAHADHRPSSLDHGLLDHWCKNIKRGRVNAATSEHCEPDCEMTVTHAEYLTLGADRRTVTAGTHIRFCATKTRNILEL